MAATGTYAIIEEQFEAMFSVRSVPRLYNEAQLPLVKSLETAVRRVDVGVRWPPTCEDVSPGTGERPLVKTYQTEKTQYVL
jgi:hypothetical protein